jgi:hypothetical protein
MTNEIPNPIPLEPTAAERHEMIATAAYYLAERRGFAPGHADADWLAAERQIDMLLAELRRRGLGRQALARTGLRNALQVWGSSE